MKAITCPVQLTGASSRADGSLGLRFATPELDAESKTAFFELINLNLKLLIQPVDSEPAGLHEVKSQFDTKTPGQRLRAVFFVLWKQADGTGDFEDFYRAEMEKMIEAVKAKLQPEQV